MRHELLERLDKDTKELKTEGLFKAERIINSAQQADITVKSGQSGHEVINFCANNYLGLANHPELLKTAKAAIDKHGYGMASVRFICGTQDIHKELEDRLSQFLETEDTILYPSCFDANGGLFEAILSKEDAIISDSLNHASIIDGIRLCKAARFRYKTNDMEDLERQLIAAKDARVKLIATDGVFSMDGTIANLPTIVDLAKKYNALTMIDDCHATGFIGENGKGTPEYHNVLGEIDIITGTLGKALGGASGGYTAGRKEIIAWLRQRSRPYLFSNTLAPVISATSIKVLDMLEGSDQLRVKLKENSQYFRTEMTKLGFDLVPGEHPIIPVMLGDAKLASDMADRLLAEGIYVIGFSFPVVPKGQARIKSGLDMANLPKTMQALVKTKREPGISLQEIPLPSYSHNDVLIRIHKTAICGTDLHIYNWDDWAQATIPVPMVVGHEYVGEVVALGSEVSGLAIGDRVSGEGHLTCGHCRNCRAGTRHLCRNTQGVGVNRPGAFAQYLSIPAGNAFKIHPTISDDVASMLDPLGNATHTALSFDMVGEDVLITGAGPIGVMACAIAKYVGARHIVCTDINDYRLNLAREAGATRIVNVGQEDVLTVMPELGMTEGFDVGLEMSGNGSALRTMLEAMHHGGKVALLGIPPNNVAIDWNQVIFKGLIIKGIYGREMFETWYKMSAMLQNGLNVDSVITHHFSYEQFQAAFDLLNTGQSGKVILDWS